MTLGGVAKPARQKHPLPVKISMPFNLGARARVGFACSAILRLDSENTDMADAGKISVRVFFITLAVAFVALVGLGVFYLAGDREEVDNPGDEVEREEIANAETETVEREYESEAEVIEGLRGELNLVNYQLERQRDVVTGSVMNNTSNPFVNVQVAFDLLGADSTRLASARDTTSEIEPGNTWQFSANVPPNTAAVYATLDTLRGEPRSPLGPESTRPPEYVDSTAGDGTMAPR